MLVVHAYMVVDSLVGSALLLAVGVGYVCVGGCIDAKGLFLTNKRTGPLMEVVRLSMLILFAL